MSNAGRRAYENVKDQIGFCGIWCGSCVVGNGTLRKLTTRYEQTITSHGLEKWGPKDFDYAEFSKGLASIQRIPACPGCRKGGGRDECEIRNCAIARGDSSCTLCDAFGECKHQEILDHMRSGAIAAGLTVAEQGDDGQKQIDNWASLLAQTWPCCILFMEGE